MDKVIDGFLDRNFKNIKDKINIEITGGEKDFYKITTADGKVFVSANNYISAFHGLYSYLQKYCKVQYSWCGTDTIDITELTMFSGEFSNTIEQKWRVYLNYCTLDYTAAWWDFKRWEKELDFMAMNGINMPLCVIGTEAVWYETLLGFSFTKEEALSTVSGPAFWAWHLMTNIDSYLPPKDEKYIYERLELGKKILDRAIELGMQPIQQGFSGHVPMKLMEKYPKAKILAKTGWCRYPKTAQLDPLDPLFHEFGTAHLKNLERLFGNYHYLACDPFHEGTPPKKWHSYLRAVGKSIDRLYKDFDENSIWVMQGWTPYKHIIKAVPKDRLLILDLNSERTPKYKNFYGYPVVSGMLHNFGGKNAMQGKIRRHCENAYLKLQNMGANVVGTGMFMEGVEQNPVVYDLQFHMLTESRKIDFSTWLDDYIERRYGKYSKVLRDAWDILMDTCYCDEGYEENEVGSALASRPHPMPIMTGPCCFTKIWYDTKKYEKALSLFLSVSDEFESSKGYQYDLCDITRQALSNRFHDTQLEFQKAFNSNNAKDMKEISKEQLDLLLDLDELLSHRKEMCLSRWVNDAHNLATDEEEKKWFDLNARTLITLWGDIAGDTSHLFDYSWREWSGLIKDYYYRRWELFYTDAIKCAEKGEKLKVPIGDRWHIRHSYKATNFGKKLDEFELNFGKTYCEYEKPENSDVIPSAKHLSEKWNIGK